MREKILGAIAWTVFFAGIATADSACLLVPFGLVMTGALLLLAVYH